MKRADRDETHCAATWPAIYAWTGSNYRNVSAQSQYASYYQQQLSSLQAQLAASPNDCLRAEVAKLQRILGSPDAGTSDATNWASSGNPGNRIFAAHLLADIGTPSALGVLGTLATDIDPLVADVATGLVQNPSRDAPGDAMQQTIGNPAGL